MKNPTLLYQDYMEEYLTEATNEMDIYISEATVHKENYYFKDNLQIPYIAPVLSNKNVREKIIEFTGTFMDTHHSKLYTSGPVWIFTFSDKETSFLYELFGLTKEKMAEINKNMFAETYQGAAQFHIVKQAPHKILITAMLVEALQKNYEDMITCCQYLFAFAEYPLVYRMFWKQGVKEDVMNYTIEHVKNKYKVKKVSNLLELLKYDMDSSLDYWVNQLKLGMDHYYINFIYRVRNQIKNTFKNIAKEYYKNNDENASQHTRADKLDDGSIPDQEGYVSNLSSVVENTYNKFISTGVNERIARAVAEWSQVDKDALVKYLNQIFTTKENQLYKLIESIITAYFSKNPTNTSVGSGEFLNFGLALYRRIGTSKDPTYQDITKILNFWVFDIVGIKNYTQNQGTIINYKRAIFNYMIWMIKYHN